MPPHTRPRSERLFLLLQAALVITILFAAPGRSSIGWRGDFETGDYSQWNWGLQAKDSSRFQAVTNPLRQGKVAGRFEVRSGDCCAGGTSGERTEVLANQETTDGYEGHEAFWAWSTYWDSSFQSDPNTAWNYFVQFHNTGDGQANIGFISNGNKLQFRVCNGTSPSSPTCRYWLLDSGRENGRWYDFVFHVRWSSDPTKGLVQVWENGAEVVPSTNLATLYPSQGAYVKQGYYRAPYSQTAILYFDGMRRGTSYSEVAADFPSSTGTTTPFTVRSSLASGSTLSGTIPWTATPSGATASSVTFSIDGSVVATDTVSPFELSLDTTKLANASYIFDVEAKSIDGRTASASSTASVSNKLVEPFSVQENLSDGQTASGSIAWTATTSGKTASKVEFSVDGQLVSAQSIAPYSMAYDTRQLPNGTHAFAVKAFATDGTTASASASVNVANTIAVTSAFSVTQNLSDGLRLDGTYRWSATLAGRKVVKVSFVIDGQTVAADSHTPWDTNVNTRKFSDGTHTFTVTAVADDGSQASVSAAVILANDATSQATSTSPTATAPTSTTSSSTTTSTNSTSTPTPSTQTSTESTSDHGSDTTSNGSSDTSADHRLQSSIRDGDTITGVVTWAVEPRGLDVSQIEFFIDSRLMWTERRAPYRYGGDNRKLDTGTLAKGAHDFEVRATGTDGSVRTLKLRVTVA